MNHPSAGVWSANGFFCHITDETGERSVKLLHLSDLHLGKRLNGFSLWEDQKYLLRQFLEITEQEAPDCVVIAGDLYDKSVPPEEAVGLLDWFLVGLSCRCAAVFLISGNHDSPERVSYGGRLMKKSGIYVAPVYEGKTEKVEFTDEYGKVCIHLLPFIKPAVVRHAFEGGEFEKEAEAVCDHQSAVKMAVSHMDIDTDVRNVLIAHQFVTGAMRCESEEVSVGGLDNIDASVFDGFDYVALGHIHSPQAVGRDQVRYCGTPLKYSFSEVGQEKSITVVELKEKGNVDISAILLRPLRDMRKIRGSYMEVTAKSFYENENCGDYLHVTLTDEEDVLDGLQKLRVIYPNIMQLEYDNRRTRGNMELTAAQAVEKKSEMELFMEFYELQNNQPMSQVQKEFVGNIIREVKE